jgi:hypothetical protein
MDPLTGPSDNGLLHGTAMRPTLREPQGWRSLEDHELVLRLFVLLDAGLSPRQRTDDVVVDEPLERSASSTCQRAGTVGEESTCLPHMVQLTDPGLGLESQSDKLRQWARLSIGLPLLVLTVSLGLSAPLLVSAPLLGGLCVGMAGLQFALVRRWLQQRQALQVPSSSVAEAAGPIAPDRNTPAGVLLVGFLSLTGMLAFIVLFTVENNNRESAARTQISKQTPRGHTHVQNLSATPLESPPKDRP